MMENNFSTHYQKMENTYYEITQKHIKHCNFFTFQPTNLTFCEQPRYVVC